MASRVDFFLGVIAALGSDCAEGFTLVNEDCEFDAHQVPGAGSIPEGTPFKMLCPATCHVCDATDNGVVLGGHTRVTEYGLHFDGQDDWATVQTTDYGIDDTWTYSLWFSKAECNPNAQVNWEFMLAHSASENSDINMNGRGAPGGDDNVHMYLGCRPNEMSENTFWRFTSYATHELGPPGNMIRIVMQDSAGGYTLTDLPLSATLEEYMMGGWNHVALSMSPNGWVMAVDGEVLPDDAFGALSCNPVRCVGFATSLTTVLGDTPVLIRYLWPHQLHG